MIGAILQVLALEVQDYLESKIDQRQEEAWKRRNKLRQYKEQQARDLDTVDKSTRFRRDFD